SNLFPGFCLAHLEDVQNQTIIFTNYSTTQGFGASIITTRQRTCLSAFVGMVEECSKWTSKEVAHSLPGKDHPSTLPARYASTLCSRHPISPLRRWSHNESCNFSGEGRYCAWRTTRPDHQRANRRCRSRRAG